MEIDFFANDCPTIRAYVLTEYASASLRLVHYVSALEAMLHDTEVMYKTYSDPESPCYNPDAATAYKDFLARLMEEWITASKAIKTLDALYAEIQALTCGEAGNLLLAVKLKDELDKVLKALETCHPNTIAWLKFRGAQLREQWSRDCMGSNAPPEIYEESDTENPDCVDMKEGFRAQLYGTGGLLDQWDFIYRSQVTAKEAAQVGLINYCAVEGNTECAQQYCAMVKQVMDWFKVHDAAYRAKLEELHMVMDSIHCGANEWEQAVDATTQTIAELQKIINEASASAGTNLQGLNSIQTGCPLPGTRPNP